MTAHGITWRISSHSTNNGDCVEVGRHAGNTHLRDTKDRDGGTLSVGPVQWQSLLTALRRPV
jgi:hypothetical protein